MGFVRGLGEKIRKLKVKFLIKLNFLKLQNFDPKNLKKLNLIKI